MSHGIVTAVSFPGLAHPSVAFIHMAPQLNKPGHSSKFNHSFKPQNIHLATRYSIHKYRCDMRGYCWCEEKSVILCYLGQLVHRRHYWCPTFQQSPLGAGDILWQLISVFWDQKEWNWIKHLVTNFSHFIFFHPTPLVFLKFHILCPVATVKNIMIEWWTEKTVISYLKPTSASSL
jgi:hypothetical protein